MHEPSSAEPFVLLVKPQGLPSAPLFEGDHSAYTQAEHLFPLLKAVQGKKSVEHGLLHRLDTATYGLLLIAATQDFYDYMQAVQAHGDFEKTYCALCTRLADNCKKEGFEPLPASYSMLTFEQPVTISSYFRPFGKKGAQVRPVSQETASSQRGAHKKYSTRLYSTHICTATHVPFAQEIWDVGAELYAATCKIRNGFRHQVRAHLAWVGLPVVGDSLYNPLYKEGQQLLFAATEIQFPQKNGIFFKAAIENPFNKAL